MAHHVVFRGELRLDINNNIILDVYAFWREKKELVYQECEDGTNFCRYIYYSQIAGYLVAFPNERISNNVTAYMSNEYQKEEDMTPCEKLNLSVLWTDKKNNYSQIINERKELKYLIQKLDKQNVSPKNAMKIILNYKKLKGVENLVEYGLISLATSNRITKLTKSKMSEVVKYILNNKDKINEHTTLSAILFSIKYKEDIKIYSKLHNFHNSYKLYKYFEGKTDYSKISYYNDYIYMCKRLNKNLKDPYWKYPKDLKKNHDKVMKEIKDIELYEEEQRKIREQKKIALEKEKYKMFENVGNSFQKLDATINGYEVYVARKTDDVANQAKELNQCLITCNYISKVGRLESLLVFIKKDGKPVATAELTFKKEIKQFYGDEFNRCNCKPNKEVSNVLDIWIDKVSVNELSRVKNMMNEKLIAATQC